MSEGLVAMTTKRVAKLLRDESGPTGTEYAILLAVLILGAMAVIEAIGQSMAAIYDNINDAVGQTGVL